MNLLIEWPWLIPAGAAVVGMLFYMVAKPTLWIGSFLIALPYFLTDVSKGISPTEVAGAALFTGGIAAWMVKRIFADPRPLVQDWLDFLLLLFIVLTFANGLVAALNGIPLLGWAVDWSYFLLMLYCFPMRELFGKDENGLKQFLTMSGVSAILMALYSSYLFKQRISENLIYAYQIMGSRSILLGPIFLLALSIAIVFVFHVRWKGKIFLSIVILTNLVGLLLTFTRTLWVFLFACVGLAMLFLKFRQSLKIATTAVLLASCTIGVFSIAYPRLTKIGVRMVTQRFSTATQLSGGDWSFETRLIEVRNAWRKVKQAPLGGHGLRARFVTWAPIEQWHNTTAFVHIGYVGLIHKLGFPTAFLLFVVIVGYSIRAFRLALRARHPSAPALARALAIGVFAFQPALYVNIFMAGFFDQRYGNVMFAFIFASIAIADRFIRHSRTEHNLRSIQ